MFDLNDPTQTKITHDNPVDRTYKPGQDVGDMDPSDDPLDSEQSDDLHTQLLSLYRRELERQAENRHEMALDEDYRDHIQYTEEMIQELEDRGQAAIVYNVIAQTLNWVIGSEKRGRTDFKILPRGKEDAKAAEGKTKYLKYLSDVNRAPFHRSRAFKDSITVGVGWIEVGAQNEDDGEPIYVRYEGWRNMLWDSASTELDGRDMRYQFRTKFVDQDIVLAMFPKRKASVLASTNMNITFGSIADSDGDEVMDFAENEMNTAGANGSMIGKSERPRIRLIEAWYRVPESVKRLRGGVFNGEIFDQDDDRHREAVDSGVSGVTERVMMVTKLAIMTPTALLYSGPSPFKHNRFKFIPVWCYRRGRDGMPYGITRGIRDIQDDINKRMSKAQYILATNKVIMDEGAVDDMDHFADEVSRPDAIIVKKQGKNIELNVDRDLAPAHLDLMSRSIGMIQQVGGVTDELLGRSTNAVSGVAVEARQEQGSISTNEPFDNLRLASQMQGELELSLVEQFVTEQKQFRITNQRGTPEFVTVNDGLPENDITRSKADFVIDEQDWNATIRQANVKQLGDLVGKMPPQVGLALLDLLIEGMDMNNGDELVKRVRQITGMRDPDATELTPEEQQAQAAQQQEAEAQKAVFMADLALKQAAAGEKQASIELKAAQIAKTKAEAARTERQMIGDSMLAADYAMVAAQAVVTMPTIAKVADNLLQTAGWKAIHTAAGGLPPMPAQAAPIQQQAPMAPQQLPAGMPPAGQPLQ